MNSNTQTTRTLQLELTEEEALALHANLLYLEYHDGVSPLTKPLMNILEAFINEQEIYTCNGIHYRKKTPLSAE